MEETGGVVAGDVTEVAGNTPARAALISCCTIARSTSTEEGAELAGGIVGGFSEVSWSCCAIAYHELAS